MGENKYLKSMQQAKAHLGQQTEPPFAPVAMPEEASHRKASRSVGRPPGKRSNPAWEQVTLFVRKDTKRAALRRLMDDQSPLDLSEVIEELLSKWVKAS